MHFAARHAVVYDPIIYDNLSIHLSIDEVQVSSWSDDASLESDTTHRDILSFIEVVHNGVTSDSAAIEHSKVPHTDVGTTDINQYSNSSFGIDRDLLINIRCCGIDDTRIHPRWTGENTITSRTISCLSCQLLTPPIHVIDEFRNIDWHILDVTTSSVGLVDERATVSYCAIWY